MNQFNNTSQNQLIAPGLSADGSKLRWLAVWVAIFAVTILLRGIGVNHQSFNMDEIYELSCKHFTVSEAIVSTDSMPPLYLLTLKAWLAVWQTDAAARWLSVLFGVLAVGFVALTARDWFGSRAAVVAGGLMAINPLAIYYSQHVRSYSLFILLAAMVLWALSRACRDDRWQNWGAFVLATTTGLYVHYYFAIVVAIAIPVGWLLRKRSNQPVGMRPVLAFVAIAFLAIPLLFLLQNDFQFQKNIRLPRPLSAASFGYTYFSMFSGYCLGPSRNELHVLSSGDAIKQVLGWGAVLASSFLLIGWFGYRQWLAERIGAISFLLILMPVLLVGGLGAVSGITYNTRFVAWCVVPICVLLSPMVLAASTKWLGRVGISLLVAVCLIANANSYWSKKYHKEDLRSTANYLVQSESNAAAGEPPTPVFIVSDYLGETLRYYTDNHTAKKLTVLTLPQVEVSNHPITSESDVESALSAVQKYTQADGNFWLVYSREFHGDPHQLLRDALLANGSLEQVAEFANVKIYRGKLINYTSQNRLVMRSFPAAGHRQLGPGIGSYSSGVPEHSGEGFVQESQIELPPASVAPASPPHEP